MALRYFLFGSRRHQRKRIGLPPRVIYMSSLWPNRKHIIVNQAKLAIDNENIRLDFNAKLKHSLELRDQLRSFNKQIAEKRADIAKRFGVKPDEFGVKN